MVLYSTVKILEPGLRAAGTDDAAQGLNEARIQLFGVLAAWQGELAGRICDAA